MRTNQLRVWEDATVTIRAVFFDVGETLVDETRSWGEWADWVKVPRFTFFAVLGAVIARGEHQARVFEAFRSGFDLETERARREAAGVPDTLRETDLYPDALECLRTLRTQGYRLGVAGNQPARTEELFREWGVPVDIVGSSEVWGAEKPTQAFFDRLIAEARVPAAEIAYVGDRVDNDVLPATEAGLRAVFLRRGPWGYAQARNPGADHAALRIDSLSELPSALSGL